MAEMETSSHWKCDKCTFENLPTNRKCAICKLGRRPKSFKILSGIGKMGKTAMSKTGKGVITIGKGVGSFGAWSVEKMGNVGKDGVDTLTDGVGLRSIGKGMNKMIIGGNKNDNGVMGEIGDLIKIVESHVNYMNEQERNINQIISSSQFTKLLENAKNAAKDTQQELIKQITTISGMNEFLTNIILIENLFNSLYTTQQQLLQTTARQKYGGNIAVYEKNTKLKKTLICDYKSFIELIFAAKTDLKEFTTLVKSIQQECKTKNITIAVNSGAKEKNIQRAFYKSFYVYGVKNGYKRMTDLLRCSFVFDNFNDLYQCFSIIEQYGILRCKDRFNVENVAFGYRDLLINIECPGDSNIICEIQLHHMLFYQYKKISHDMYKKARLFEQKNENLAYKYAQTYIGDNIGDKLYECTDGYDDEKKEEMAMELMDGYELLKEWGLSQYGQILIEEQGYEDVEDWKILSQDELNKMGFKPGHSRKFIRKLMAI